MVKLRSRPAAAAAAGGILTLGAIVVAPAFAYPPGTALTIACDAFTYSPGGPATCTLSNVDPDGPDDIVLGGQVGAAGSGLTFARASFLAQDAGTYTEVLTLPQTPGTYEVIGTSAGETATTTVRVVASGVPTEFSVVVNDDGSVTVFNAVPGCTVTVFVDGEPIGSFTVGGDGSVTVPANVVNAAAGASITASQEATDSCTALEAEPVVVGGGGTGQPDGEDTIDGAATGANVTLGVVAGLGALGLGGGLYAASRRKKV